MEQGLPYEELLKLFNKHEVEYMVVGGFAVNKYADTPRQTPDIDIWINTTEANAQKVYNSLLEFGSPLQEKEVTPEMFTKDKLRFTFELRPLDIDIFTSITGVIFRDAWENRNEADISGIKVNFISRETLITAKRSVGREKDLLDIQKLEHEQIHSIEQSR